MKNRRGVSLVELLLVMSAATVILTMSAGLIHRIMHAQSKARSFVDVERSSLRLANTLRCDVHQATAASAGDADLDEGVFLHLRLPENQTIEYHCQQGAVQRVLLEAGKTVSRDEFVFPPGIELAIRKSDPCVVILTLNSRPGEMPTDDGRSEPNAYSVPVSLQVEAALSRDVLLTSAMPTERRSP